MESNLYSLRDYLLIRPSLHPRDRRQDGVTKHARAEQQTGNLSTKPQSPSAPGLFPRVQSEGNSNQEEGSEEAGTAETKLTMSC